MKLSIFGFRLSAFLLALAAFFITSCADEKGRTQADAKKTADEKMAQLSAGNASILSVHANSRTNRLVIKVPQGQDIQAYIQVYDEHGIPLHDQPVLLESSISPSIDIPLAYQPEKLSLATFAVIEQQDSEQIASEKKFLFKRSALLAKAAAGQNLSASEAEIAEGTPEATSVLTQETHVFSVTAIDQNGKSSFQEDSSMMPVGKNVTLSNIATPTGCKTKIILYGERSENEWKDGALNANWNGWVQGQSYATDQCGNLIPMTAIETHVSMHYTAGTDYKVTNDYNILQSSHTAKVQALMFVGPTFDNDICGRATTHKFYFPKEYSVMYNNTRIGYMAFDTGNMGCNQMVADALRVFCVAGALYAASYSPPTWLAVLSGVATYNFIKTNC